MRFKFQGSNHLMGCAASCLNCASMALFGRLSNNDNSEYRAKLDRKLYLAKESPEPDFNLSDCQLRHLPSGIFSLCKVFRKEYLYLQNNNLQTLEEGGQLSDLYLTKVLNISSNKFSELSIDIRFLVNLTELYLQDNEIKYLPLSIQHLESLQILDVSKNKLLELTPSIGKLKSLRKLNLRENCDLNELCPDICFAANIVSLELDEDQFVTPSSVICKQGVEAIMKYFCGKLNIEYTPPYPIDIVDSVQSPVSFRDPFVRRDTLTWEEQEHSIIEQENKIHRAAKEQREKFMSMILHDQLELDNEIAKVQEAKELDRLRLIKTIQQNESDISSLVKNFLQSVNLKPEVIQQQLAYEQAEHDRLLEISRQNYDNIKRADVLKSMEKFIEDDYSSYYARKQYEDFLNMMKQNMLIHDNKCSEKISELLRVKDGTRSDLLNQLLEDHDVQKAIVASLLERVDSRSWSLNEEISLISSNLARLSAIEKEKKKLQVSYNYNELLHQRVHLLSLLDNLFQQQNLRRKQLIATLQDMEEEHTKSADFWLKNYQKLIEAAPKSCLDCGKHLDPIFANFLLEESVIHCLPFLVKFLFSETSLLDVTAEQLKTNGVSLSSDRDGILKAINKYVKSNIENNNVEATLPSAPTEDTIKSKQHGVVSSSEENDNSILSAECIICMDCAPEMVFVPCGHICCCQKCSYQKILTCPMCRTEIERTIKVIVS